jgi:hypothetical protein
VKVNEGAEEQKVESRVEGGSVRGKAEPNRYSDYRNRYRTYMFM